MTTLKSKLMKLLMLGLLVLTAFAFIACGDKGGDDDDSGSVVVKPNPVPEKTVQ